MPRSSQPKPCMHFLHTYHMPCPSHSPCFDHLDNVGWGIQRIKLFIQLHFQNYYLDLRVAKRHSSDCVPFQFCASITFSNALCCLLPHFQVTVVLCPDCMQPHRQKSKSLKLHDWAGHATVPRLPIQLSWSFSITYSITYLPKCGGATWLQSVTFHSIQDQF